MGHWRFDYHNEFVKASLMYGSYCVSTHNFIELHYESLLQSYSIISNRNSQKTPRKT